MPEVNDHFPFPDGPLATQPPEYVRRRSACPLSEVELPSGDRAVLAVRYEDVEQIMRDPSFSRDMSAPGSPRLFPADALSDDPDFLVNMHGADHLRLRRIVGAAFTPRRANAWRPEIREILDNLLDPIQREGQPVDLIHRLSFPMPIRVICRQLGVPQEDSERFRSWVEAFLSVSTKSSEERTASITEFTDYVVRLIEQHRREPAGDLIDHLINARDADDQLSEDELVSMTRGLIVGGNETIANSLSRLLLTLLTQRKILEMLVADPELIPSTVEELLRVNPPGRIGLMRMATTDVMLPSGPVAAGRAVISPLIAAGHDPAVFPEPEEFRLNRPGPPSLVFGAGAHYCLGAHLAKVELQEAIGALVRRFPTLYLTRPAAELPWSSGLWAVALRGLPVAW